MPNATVTFSSPVPEGVEVIPVVFITLEALEDMTRSGRTAEVADKIYTRIDAMARSHALAPLRTIQIDCDYTARTREGYFALCRSLGAVLKEHRITLSSTLRLHQLRDAVPPVDEVSLMLYNTGNFRRTDTENSILDPAVVQAYLKGKYRLPASVALPVYSWGIWMRDGAYKAILHQGDYSDTLSYAPVGGNLYKVLTDHTLEGHALRKGDLIRWERSDYEMVQAVHNYAQAKLRTRPVILYHLDSLCLSRYTYDEIENLYGYAQD